MASFIVEIKFNDDFFTKKLAFTRRRFLGLLGHDANKILLLEEYLETLALSASDEAFGHRKKDLVPSNSKIVFRLDLSRNWANETDTLHKFKHYLHKYTSRNKDNEQYLLYSADYKQIVEPLNIENNKFREADLLNEFRTDEMTMFLSTTESIFDHGRHAFFELPSKAFSDYFIRVGNAQTQAHFGNSVFFWSLPYLQNVKSIFADTWSISTSAAVIAGLLEAYRNKRSAIEWDYAVNYLPYAHIGKSKLQANLAKLKGTDDSLLFISSFNSTGRVRGEVIEIANKLGLVKNLEYLDFFSTQDANSHQKCLCSILDYLEKKKLSGSREIRTANKPIFEIHPRTYIPDYRKIDVTKFRVSYAKYKTFFEKYAAKNITSVYRTGSTLRQTGKDGYSTKNRHHAFHIDAIKLFSDKEFVTEMQNSLVRFKAELTRKKERPIEDYILITNGTKASKKLGEVFSNNIGYEAHGIISTDVDFSDIESNPKNKDKFVSKESYDKTIVICLPMVVAGGSLSHIQIGLREIFKEHGIIHPNIVFLIGLMRPNSNEKIKELSEIYLEDGENEKGGWAHALVIESVVLPNWQDDRCPWTREYSIIVETLDEAPNLLDSDRQALLTRKDVLENPSETGLKDADVFFTRKDERLQFNPDSRFLDTGKVPPPSAEKILDNQDDYDFAGNMTTHEDVTEADLCCAVASAIQIWRQESKQSPLHFSTIDAATITNLNGYNESRLRASIWRSLTPKELSSVTRLEESDFSTFIKMIFDTKTSDQNYSDLEMEALLAFQMDIPRSIEKSLEEWDWNTLKYMAAGTKI